MKSSIWYLLFIFILISVGACKQTANVLPPLATGNAPIDSNDEPPVTAGPTLIIDADSAPVVEYRGNAN